MIYTQGGLVGDVIDNWFIFLLFGINEWYHTYCGMSITEATQVFSFQLFAIISRLRLEAPTKCISFKGPNEPFNMVRKVRHVISSFPYRGNFGA